jgi:Methylamine utilisation protein MauE
MELIGLYLIAAGLLVAAGVGKAARPDDTARAMAALLPGPLPFRLLRGAVRAGALAEAALGVLAVVFPRPVTAVLVALSYLCFFGVVALARWRGGPLATCGCFGRPDTPPTALHLIIDLTLAAAALAVANGAPGGGTLGTLLAHQPGAGFPLLFVSAVGLWLTALALSALAALTGARRLARPVPAPTS